MKKLIPITIAALALGLVSCKNEIQESPFIDQNIAVILRSPTDTLGLQVAKGIIGAGIQYGVYADLFSANSNSDYQGQIAILENLDLNQYVGIVIVPTSDTALNRVVGELNARIPVVVVGTPLQGDVEILSFVGTDNVAAGESLATTVNKQLSAGDSVNIIQLADNSVVAARLFGFFSRMEELGHQTVTSLIQSNDDLSVVVSALVDENHPGIKAIVAGDASTAIGVSAILRNMNRSDIKLFTFTITPAVANGIRDGSIAGTMASDTYGVGYNAVLSIVNEYIGITPSRTQYQQTMYIDRDNISSSQADRYINNI